MARRAGGLEVAIALASQAPSRHLVRLERQASPPRPRSRSAHGRARRRHLHRHRSRRARTYQEYYNGFANRMLWPILHYRLDLAEFSRRDLSGYHAGQRAFRRPSCTRCCSPTTSIWVHDYHLLPLAKALRERGHENRIGFFLHIPFPPPEILTALPNHERIIPALCHYDLVGFQTDIDADNFARYLDQRMPHAEPRPRARSSPASAPCGSARSRSASRPRSSSGWRGAPCARRSCSEVLDEPVRPRHDHRRRPARLFQGHRRCGMEAFERFLADHPRWRGNVTYLQITPRAAPRSSEYADMERQHQRDRRAASTAPTARRRGRRSATSTAPYSRTALAGLYRASRAALVTPLRDGMNLVAKEYVAAQDPEDPGVLILSRFAGAAVECEAALLVNPYDPEAVGGRDRPGAVDAARGAAAAATASSSRCCRRTTSSSGASGSSPRTTAAGRAKVTGAAA